MEEKKDILPSDEELDKADSLDLLNSQKILEDIKKEKGEEKLEEKKSKKKEPLSEKDFSFDESENIEPDVDTEGEDKKKGLLLDIHDDDELSEEDDDDRKLKDRDFSTEMAVASVVATFFSLIVFLIKIFNFSSVLGLIFTTLMFFVIWFGITMLIFFLMYSNFTKIYMLFFKMDEKLSMTSAGAAGSKDNKIFEPDNSDDKSVLGDGVVDEDWDAPSSGNSVFGSPTSEERTKVDDFDFSFDNKDMAKAVRSMISGDEVESDKKE